MLHNMRKKRKFTRAVVSGAVAVVLAFGFTSGVVSASGFDSMKLIQKVYHVSVDGQEIGIVNDKGVIEELIGEMTVEAEKEYPTLQFAVAEDVTYKADKIFRPETNKDDLAAALKNELTLRAKAAQLVVGDEKVGYFKSDEEAKNALQLFKQKYVAEDALKQFNKKTEKKQKEKQSGNEILDIKLSKEISFEETKVTPDELLSVEQGVKLLEKETIEQKNYTVEKGDTFESIAKRFNLSLKDLLEINPEVNEEDVLSIDTELKVTVPEPFLKVIVTKSVTKNEEIPYDTVVEEDDSILKGNKEVTQKGNEGEKKVTYEITEENGKTTKKKVVDENVLQEPEKEVIVKGTKVIPSRGSGSLSWPAVGGYISSYMGPRWGSLHKGIDIARPGSRAILAADNGRVISAGYDSSGYGNRIIISHNNGMKTTYSHLSSIHVSAGDVVAKGEQIGVMGATGNVTGVHLHFEVYANGQLKNPMDYLN
jgi:murein DD-endopeptidase MepM/ murein hydrolase activator NlpD